MKRTTLNKFWSVARLTLVFGVLVVFGQNCTGGFKPLGGFSDSSSLGVGGHLVYKCTDPNVRGITADRLRKLTLRQLKNTLRDLLGTTITADAEFKQKLASIPDDTVQFLVSEVNDNPSLHHAKALYDLSSRAIVMMNANPQLRVSILGRCTTGPIDEACVRSVVSEFGRRVLRRPPTAAETDTYVGFYNSMGGGTAGLDYLFARLMQNPTLVFHVENGGTPSNGRYRLDDYEIASRISYMTADTMPDDALLDAAAKGELQTLENVRTHVTRLLVMSDGVAKVQDFFRFYTHLKETVPNSKAAASSGVDLTGLSAEMKREALDFVDHVVFSTPGTFEDLMTSTASFPRSAKLANIMETTPISQTKPVSTSVTHPGLFHRPGLLVSPNDRTSPILRGALIRKVVLCDVLGEPPADAVAARADEVGDLSLYSNRDGTERLTSAAACSSCHGAINPLGHSFERYDQLGARRTVEPIFDTQGNIVRTFPIETQVASPNIETGGPTHLNDSNELVRAIASSTKAKACYSRRMFEYYTLRQVDGVKDGCALAENERSTATRDLKSALIDSIANEDIFWRKQP